MRGTKPEPPAVLRQMLDCSDKQKQPCLSTRIFAVPQKSSSAAGRISQLERQLEESKQRCAMLEAELTVALTEYVPPTQFLPRVVHEQHRESIDLLNDYALMYRHARLELLGQEGLAVARGVKDGEKTEELNYLRSRVAALTSQVIALQEQLATRLMF